MLSNRTKNLKSSPTLALATKAKELKAEGHDVISLSVGEPDWDTADAVKEVGIAAIREGQTKYSPAAGSPELRKAIAEQISADLGLDYSFEEVTATTGAKFIVFSALQALVDPGDEVIIPAPYWVSYPTMVELADGQPIVVECRAESQYKLTADQLRSVLNEKTKVLMLNSPSNPTGEVYSLEELKEIAAVLKDFPKVAILSDDIYNRLVFEGKLAPHLLQAAPELRDRTLNINGVSKSYAMTGWRVGWAVGPKEVISAMTKYQSQSATCASSISLAAATHAVKHGDADIAKAVETLKERLDFAMKSLQAIDGVQVERPGGAFYLWPNISSFFGKTFKGKVMQNSSDICDALLEEKKVVIVPGRDFGLEGYVRLSYALKNESMQDAFERMADFFAQLK